MIRLPERKLSRVPGALCFNWGDILPCRVENATAAILRATYGVFSPSFALERADGQSAISRAKKNHLTRNLPSFSRNLPETTNKVRAAHRCILIGPTDGKIAGNLGARNLV